MTRRKKNSAESGDVRKTSEDVQSAPKRKPCLTRRTWTLLGRLTPNLSGGSQ